MNEIYTVDETYILMCKEAKEIQEQWKATPGDLISNGWNNVEVLAKLTDRTMLGDGTETKTFWTHDDLWYVAKGRILSESKIIWLPRQEDIQRIYMKEKQEAPGDVLNQFYQFYLDKERKKEVLPCILEFNSVISMYWFVFVMETVYNKQWNGETWDELR